VPRDDWKYDEDMWEDEGEEKQKVTPEKQCPQCSHWLPHESPYCSWCGKVFEEQKDP
jgi:DNA-directed RNA polymerase subunit RPC12/RpoP